MTLPILLVLVLIVELSERGVVMILIVTNLRMMLSLLLLVMIELIWEWVTVMVLHHILTLGHLLLGHVHSDEEFHQDPDIDAILESFGGSPSSKCSEKTADGENAQDPTEKAPKNHLAVRSLDCFSRTSNATVSFRILRFVLVSKQIGPEQMSRWSSISLRTSFSQSSKSRIYVKPWLRVCRRVASFLVVIHGILIILLSMILFSQLSYSSNRAEIITLGFYFLVGAPFNKCSVFAHALSFLTLEMVTLQIKSYFIQNFLSQINLSWWLLLHVWTHTIILLSCDHSMYILILLKIVRRYKRIIG